MSGKQKAVRGNEHQIEQRSSKPHRNLIAWQKSWNWLWKSMKLQNDFRKKNSRA